MEKESKSLPLYIKFHKKKENLGIGKIIFYFEKKSYLAASFLSFTLI